MATQNPAGRDRAGLLRLMDQFLASLPKHDPAGLPLAGNVKCTEQAAQIPVGDGL